MSKHETYVDAVRADVASPAGPGGRVVRESERDIAGAFWDNVSKVLNERGAVIASFNLTTVTGEKKTLQYIGYPNRGLHTAEPRLVDREGPDDA